MQKGEEARSRFFVSGGDSTPPFDGVEEALNQIALLVELFVAVAFGFSKLARRNDRFNTSLLQLVDNPIGVVGSIGQNSARLNVVNEFFRYCRVVLLAWSYEHVHRASLHIHHNMDFRRKSPSGATYSVFFGPP